MGRVFYQNNTFHFIAFRQSNLFRSLVKGFDWNGKCNLYTFFFAYKFRICKYWHSNTKRLREIRIEEERERERRAETRRQAIERTSKLQSLFDINSHTLCNEYRSSFHFDNLLQIDSLMT